jgi:hypothetical protein
MTESTKKDSTKSASIRLDEETEPAINAVREHMVGRLPGVRPTTADVMRWALLDASRRVAASPKDAGEVIGQAISGPGDE